MSYPMTGIVMPKIRTLARRVKGRHATPRPLAQDNLSVKYSGRWFGPQLRR
jgi:hypothetical protein